MTDIKYREENKAMRDEICRQRIALKEYKKTIRDIVGRYKNKGVNCCRLVAENAILKMIVASTPKAKKIYDNIDFEASIKKICDGVPEFRDIAQGS